MNRLARRVLALCRPIQSLSYLETSLSVLSMEIRGKIKVPSLSLMPSSFFVWVTLSAEAHMTGTFLKPDADLTLRSKSLSI